MRLFLSFMAPSYFPSPSRLYQNLIKSAPTKKGLSFVCYSDVPARCIYEVVYISDALVLFIHWPVPKQKNAPTFRGWGGAFSESANLGKMKNLDSNCLPSSV